MELLKEKIIKSGKVFPGNILKVDGFLNHQVDTALLSKMGKEIKRLFGGEKITKILTIESSGIAIAAFAAYEMQIPFVFAKKSQTKNISAEVYTSKVMSYTHGKVYDIIVSSEYLSKEDKILIVDDFLANGKALIGLIDLCKQAGAEVVGCAIAIEKSFQGGGDELRKKGVKVFSLAVIDEMTPEGIKFRR